MRRFPNTLLLLIVLMFLTAFGNNALSCERMSPSQETAQELKLQPSFMNTVRNFNDLKKFDGQRVMLIGRYERTMLPKSARPGAPLMATRKAEIVLADGVPVFIYPLWSERSQRPEEELQKYQGQPVKAVGVVNFEQGDDPKLPQAARIVGPCIHLDRLELASQQSR